MSTLPPGLEYSRSKRRIPHRDVLLICSLAMLGNPFIEGIRRYMTVPDYEVVARLLFPGAIHSQRGDVRYKHNTIRSSLHRFVNKELMTVVGRRPPRRQRSQHLTEYKFTPYGESLAWVVLQRYIGGLEAINSFREYWEAPPLVIPEDHRCHPDDIQPR